MKQRICSLMLCLAAGLAWGQASTFPTKPIRIMVPFNAGSGADSGSRFYGDLLVKLSGHAIVVENRPGGSGIFAVQAVKNAPADGYTLLMATNSPMTVNPVAIKNPPYDPQKYLRPVIGVSRAPVAFIVRADSPDQTIKDMVEGTRKSGAAHRSSASSGCHAALRLWQPHCAAPRAGESAS